MEKIKKPQNNMNAKLDFSKKTIDYSQVDVDELMYKLETDPYSIVEMFGDINHYDAYDEEDGEEDELLIQDDDYYDEEDEYALDADLTIYEDLEILSEDDIKSVTMEQK